MDSSVKNVINELSNLTLKSDYSIDDTTSNYIRSSSRKNTRGSLMSYCTNIILLDFYFNLNIKNKTTCSSQTFRIFILTFNISIEFTKRHVLKILLTIKNANKKKVF